MKNGETDTRYCAPVVGPDLTNVSTTSLPILGHQSRLGYPVYVRL